jgi:thioredoxin-related protein
MAVELHGRTHILPNNESTAGAKLGWKTDLKAAQDLARSQNKYVLMDFTGSDWCPYCMMLQQQVFSTPEFKAYAAKHLVLMKVDFPKTTQLPAEQQAANDALAEQYNIEAFPTIVVLAPDGTVAGELGYEPDGPAAFLDSLRQLEAQPATS